FGRRAAYVFDPDRATAFEDDAQRQRPGLDRQVAAGKRRAQIGFGGAAAASVADRLLHPAEALLLRAIVIVGGRQLQRAAGAKAGLDQRILVAGGTDGQRAVAAAIVAGTALPRFL